MSSGSIYGVSTLGTPSNQIIFNQQGVYPYYRLKQRMPTKWQLKEYDVDIPEQMGVADWQSFIAETHYVLQGIMYPKDQTTYDSGRRALRKLGDLNTELADTNADYGYVPYTWTLSDGTNQTVYMKVDYIDLPEASINGLKQPFRIFAKIKYPAILGDAVSANLGSSGATTIGSSNLSFTLPHALGLTTYSSNGTINNTGDLAAWPSFVINGPVTNPKITNTTTGQYIQFTDSLGSGDSIILTYDQDSLSATKAGNSVLNELTTGSTLFTIKSGINNLTFTGDTIGSGAFATVSCRPTWPLA